MSDWSNDLNAALAAGDAAVMKAMLDRVPKDVLQRTIPYLEVMAKNSATDGRLEEALTYYSQLIEVEPGNVIWLERRARVYIKLDQLQESMVDARRITELNPQIALGHRLMAETHDGLRERQLAVAAYERVLQLEPNDGKSKERIQFLVSELNKEALLKRTLNPDAAQDPLQIELPKPPEVRFNPALFVDPAIPESFEKTMVDGLRQHLLRYSGHQSSKNALARLADPEWTAVWDSALRITRGSSVFFRSCELGVFALRARKHGAARVSVAEQFPLDERIASGVIQKNILAEWHALHGAEIQKWSESDRRASFEDFIKDICVDSLDSEDTKQSCCDYFAFPNIDHSLLGTGIVKAIHKFRSRGVIAADTKMLPARARLYATPIQWNYSSSGYDLDLVNDLRWGFYPQSLEADRNEWVSLSEPTFLGVLDFENFGETQWCISVPIKVRGQVDAIVYWFELDIGDGRISNAPGSALGAIRPAVQYVDSLSVEPEQMLSLRVDVYESRLCFQVEQASNKLRSHLLPSWYIPMLLDRPRNEAFYAALGRRIAAESADIVLDIGAGCGLLSMQAAQAGAKKVFACEISAVISKLGQDIIKSNGFDDRITMINKDCRKITVPGDLLERADLAVFELFDCSLIGEGVLHFIAYAREHLLKKDARVLPMGGKIRAMIIEYRVDRILEVDVNLLNPYRFSPTFINVDANALNYRPLTDPFDVFAFDFATATPVPDEKEMLIPVTSAGTAGAVLFWFDLQIDESNWLSNAPKGDRLHWRQGLQFLVEVRVGIDSTLPIVAKHDGSGLSFKWKQEALQKESISALPRFDPRCWQQTKELEHQTRGLLQHCMQSAEEYKKVAEVAQRFAVDPATHDLDPIVAQRFAATFFGV